MEFFNKKEEVIDLKLTQFGRLLLSKGKFKPVYYSFFDEGILYDGARGDITEDQNDIQYRIKNTTPYMKNTAEFLSADQIAKRGELVPNEIDAREISLFDFDSSYLEENAVQFTEAPVFYDDRPLLEHFNVASARIWREEYKKAYTDMFAAKGIALFE